MYVLISIANTANILYLGVLGGVYIYIYLGVLGGVYIYIYLGVLGGVKLCRTLGSAKLCFFRL